MDPMHPPASTMFEGPGEMRARCRSFNWAATPLGPIDQWTLALRTAVQIVLGSGLPMMVLWGRDLTQIYNDAYAALIRHRHPAALGHRYREVWPDMWRVNAPTYARVFRGATVTQEDTRYPLARGSSGGDAYVTVSYCPVREQVGDKARAVAGIVATMIECTQLVRMRRLSEERERLYRELTVERARLEQIFRHAPTFLAVARGPNHVLELANDTFLDFVGHRAIIGKPFFDTVPELADQGFRSLVDRVLFTGEPFVGRGVPAVLHRTPGAPPEERFFDFTYVPLLEADGTRSGVIAHGADVTAHVHAQREAERLLAESDRARADAERARADAEVARIGAEAADRAKSGFLSTMSHELRTPLNAIAGYAELLELGLYGPLTPAQLQAVERIQMSERHLLGLINTVLNYSRLEVGAIHFFLEDVAVAEVLAACEALTMPQARSKRLTYVVERPPSGLLVHADREKLQQIVLNMLANAIKFTPSGGAVRVWSELVGDRTVQIHVADTGVGIPRDRLEQIFEPFVQVDAGLTRTYEGTGLGLAISRDLARGMGGNLTAESTKGAGSIFTLTQPATHPARSATRGDQAPPSMPRPADPVRPDTIRPNALRLDTPRADTL